MNDLIIICGVSASGKSTTALRLAVTIGCLFLEGDDFHPLTNIEKMKSQIALTDTDRKDWIASIANHVNTVGQNKYVLSCSALTPFVQDELTQLCNAKIHWIILDLPQDIALNRAQNRDHFMPPELIKSQFKAWSPPKNGLKIDATLPTNDIIERILAYISK